MNYYLRVLIVFGITALTFFSVTVAGRFSDNDNPQDEIFAVSTVSDISRLVNLVSFYSLLKTDVSTGVILEEKHFIGFSNYLDFNIVGAGKMVFVYPEKIAEYVSTQINEGTPPDKISGLLIQKFQEGVFTVNLTKEAANEDEFRVRIGTYFVGEFEYHQEPDGEFIPLLEVNQAKLFFSASYKSPKSASNIMNFLAEFNPVPEEVIHQIDEFIYTQDSVSDTISFSTPEGEGPIPFERLQFSISDVGGSGFNLTIGQIRNPFGIWSDFTSHRNFSSTKNNTLISGYALKKIELGLMAEKTLGSFTVAAAVVHGRMGRTAPLFRADNDEHFDAVTRITYARKNITAGVSGYFAEFGTRRMAAGADILIELGRLLAGAEFVYQKNDYFSDMYSTANDISSASSLAGYLQLDYSLTGKLHLYTMADAWRLRINGETENPMAVKTFAGIRYYLVKNIRWTVVEYGRMFHKGFDEGNTHLSTQLEVTF